MAQVDKIAEIAKLADKSRQLCSFAQAEIDELMKQVNEKKSIIEIERSKLDAFQQTLDILQPQKVSGSSDRFAAAATPRRMRLGAKKRMIYELVALGYPDLEYLNRCLENTDIDHRYVRDVVRDAITEGDMIGNVDQKFYITDHGRSILEKANKPNDWLVYKPELDRFIEANAKRGLTEAQTATNAGAETSQEPVFEKTVWD